MKLEPPIIKGFGVRNPKGCLLLGSISLDPRATKRKVAVSHRTTWEVMHEKGYTLIEVTIKEDRK